MLIVDVSIDLSSSDGCMSQERLHSSDICALFDESRSKAMSQDMRCDLGRDTHESGIVFDKTLDRVSRQSGCVIIAIR